VSIIEQAARRLEELRRSGVDVSSVSPRAAGSAAGPVQTVQPAARQAAVHRPVVREVTAQPRPEPAAQSRKVEIDLTRLAAMGYLVPDAPRLQIADEFRVIKRPLLTNVHGESAAPVKDANLIMVTSSLPGEGKTFVAVNLAISLAMELDTTVLLVDADVARPSVLSRLGLPPSAGLLDVLTNPGMDMSEVMLRTNLEKLSLLPAGKPQGRATELLASGAMDKLLGELSTRYADRIVVFDAPPLLPSTESRVLASRMGQVIMVVEADHTPQRSVAQALATIEACPVVMTLLNKTSRSEVGSYHGYYGPLED
jgi:protein-tyrosine kinase